jgi:pantetheine-phosphate adenylyltransferase
MYPGSFDPPTIGHWDVVKRGIKLCDKLVIGISDSDSGKRFMFSAEERKIMFESYFKERALPVEVHIYEGLTVDYARELGAVGLLRGLRTYSDFEYEFQMAAMNKALCPRLETIFIRTSDNLGHISSTFVKAVASHASVKRMVSSVVAEYLAKKI